MLLFQKDKVLVIGGETSKLYLLTLYIITNSSQPMCLDSFRIPEGNTQKVSQSSVEKISRSNDFTSLHEQFRHWSHLN